MRFHVDVVKINQLKGLFQSPDKRPALFNVPASPLSRQHAPVLHEVHEVFGKVLHRLGGCVGTDVPGGAVDSHRPAAVVGAVKCLPKLPVGHLFRVMMSQGMCPFMAEQLAQGAPLRKAEFGQDSRASNRGDMDVASGSVVLPAKAAKRKGPEPNLHLGHGIAPKA